VEACAAVQLSILGNQKYPAVLLTVPIRLPHTATIARAAERLPRGHEKGSLTIATHQRAGEWNPDKDSFMNAILQAAIRSGNARVGQCDRGCRTFFPTQG
jgi:hypothetical protein